MEEVQQIPKELGRRQTTYVPSLKALIRPHSLQEWNSRYCSPPPEPSIGHRSPCQAQLWHKTFIMLGNPLLIRRKLTNSGDECRLCEKPKTERKLGNQKLFQLAIKSPVKVTQMQIWFDFHIARTPSEKINGQPAMLVSLWKALKPEQQFRLILLGSSGVPNILPAPAGASEL